MDNFVQDTVASFSEEHTMDMQIDFALPTDAEAVASLAIALTDEIIQRTGAKHFDVNLPETVELCRSYLESGIYQVVVAREAKEGVIIGFAAMCQSHALYTEGAFGVIQEFYVRPEFRSQRVGARILDKAAEFAKAKGWKRLELCTPPQPQFDETIRFYQQNGFDVTGGRKMKRPLA